MIVTCANCQTKFNLPDGKIPEGGAKVKCSKCSHVFKVAPPAAVTLEDEVESLLEEDSQAPDTSAGDDFDETFNEVAADGQADAEDSAEASAEEPAEDDLFGESDEGPAEEPALDDAAETTDEGLGDDDLGSLFDDEPESGDDLAEEPGDDFVGGVDEPADETMPGMEDLFDDTEDEEAPADDAASVADDVEALFGDDDAGEEDDIFGDDSDAGTDDIFADDDGAGADEDIFADSGADADDAGDASDDDIFADDSGESGDDIFDDADDAQSTVEDIFGDDDDEDDEEDEGDDEIFAPTADDVEDDDDDEEEVHTGKTDFGLDEEPVKEKPGKAVPILIILLVLVLGIGAAVYFKAWTLVGMDTESLKNIPYIGKMFMEETGGDEAAAPGESPADRVRKIELRNVKQYYVANEKTGNLFVVEGKAVNKFEDPKEQIKVEVILYDGGGNVLTSQSFLCGNQLSQFQLQVQTKAEVEEGLASEVGILSNNTFIRPGGSVPFMAVFFEPPAGVKEFLVKVVDVSDPK